MNQYAAQYILLKMDTGNGTEWTRWQTRYPPKGRGIPSIFIVRADGEQIYSGSGAPGDLAGFLGRYVPQVGKILTPGELKTIQRGAKLLQAATRRKKDKEVAKLLAEYGSEPSYAAPAVQFYNLAEEYFKKTEAEIVTSAKDLKEGTKAFQAAIRLKEIASSFAELARIQEALKKSLKDLEEQEQSLLELAEKVVTAKNKEAERDKDAAITLYQEIVKNHPGTEAATFSQERIAGLHNSSSPSSSGSPSKTSGQPSAVTKSADVKKAESLVRLGKILLKKNPNSAKSYFQKAIDLAPDSDAAKEAKSLLK